MFCLFICFQSKTALLWQEEGIWSLSYWPLRYVSRKWEKHFHFHLHAFLSLMKLLMIRFEKNEWNTPTQSWLRIGNLCFKNSSAKFVSTMSFFLNWKIFTQFRVKFAQFKSETREKRNGRKRKISSKFASFLQRKKNNKNKNLVQKGAFKVVIYLIMILKVLDCKEKSTHH